MSAGKPTQRWVKNVLKSGKPNLKAPTVLRLILFHFTVLMLPLTAIAQDVVVHRSSTGTPIRREGTIVDWRSLTLELEQSGRVQMIDGDQVLSIETQWPDGYQTGLNELSRRQFSAATGPLRKALSSERRRWAQVIIASKLLQCQLAIQDLPSAAQTFFGIVALDPQSRFVPLCPLRWSGNDPAMNQQARDWIQSDQPVVQLLGASWLVGVDARSARPVLEELARDIDPSVAGLAVGQLWNLRQTEMSAAEIDVWIKRIETMPIAVRAGPRLAIASAQQRSGFTDAAIASFMRIVILHPDQALIRPAALFQSARLLHNTDRTAESQRLIAELRSQYPNSTWASREITR